MQRTYKPIKNYFDNIPGVEIIQMYNRELEQLAVDIPNRTNRTDAGNNK